MDGDLEDSTCILLSNPVVKPFQGVVLRWWPTEVTPPADGGSRPSGGALRRFPPGSERPGRLVAQTAWNRGQRAEPHGFGSEKKPTNGLHPSSDGLQPTRDGLRLLDLK